MTWWRRLVGFLARKELAAVRAEMDAMRLEFCRLGIDHGMMTELVKQQAYADGEYAGIQRMEKQIEETIRERTRGLGDYVQTEDLTKAKKGLVH